ncbi:MAG: hypothetical protein M3O70_25205, partial [Actinomycetota bacterium]|nr:hypothetical protein [Actinomycetota bacterium]
HLGLQSARPRRDDKSARPGRDDKSARPGRDRYEHEKVHGTRLPRAAVQALARRLSALPGEQRKQLGPMEPGREDVIAGGALIVEGVLDRFGFSELVASEADSLDGLVTPG